MGRSATKVRRIEIRILILISLRHVLTRRGLSFRACEESTYSHFLEQFFVMGRSL